MKNGIKVYYALSTGTIESGVLVSVRGNVARFADGGWNPADCCYLTRQQCARATVFPSPKGRRAIECARVELSRAAKAIDTALNRLVVE